MPSPFPGMDPFLEDPQIFPDFHDSFVIYLKEKLRPILPEPYYAAARDRVWVEVSKRYVDPDVHVGRKNGGVSPPSEHAPQGNGGVAVAPRASPVIVHVPHDETREPFLEIYARQGETRRLVTCIELLSPTNKAPGHGRELYLQKQREMLEARVHLVEIDLLRGGEHSTAVPLEHAVEKAGPFDYHICCHRFDRWLDYIVYPIRLEQPLPVLAIPLLPGDPDVEIDLQAVFDRCYDAGFYPTLARYSENQTIPPLRAEQASWATGLLREKRLLPKS